jgi:hypothetical protein
LSACEIVEIPTSPEATSFNIVQIETVSPTPNTVFTVGQTGLLFQQEIFYQRSDAEFADEPEVPAYFWVETFDQRDGEYEWEGDLAFDFGILNQQKGSVTISGTFDVPRISPFCGPYDRVRTFTVVDVPAGTSTDTRVPRSGLSNKASLSENYNFSNFQVGGAPTLINPCVIELESYDQEFVFYWGQPVWIWGRRMLADESPTVGFGGGEIIDFTLSTNASSYEGWDLVQTWVPARAQSGVVSVAYESGQAVDYGADRAPNIVVDEAAGDYFEPNDSWDTASQDRLVWGDDVGWVINPGLTIDDIDELEDETANPYGYTGWGRGDWWEFEVPGSTCVQVYLRQEVDDDMDLFLWNADNLLVDTDWSVATEWSFASYTTPVTAGTSTVRIWVAPWDIVSDISRYELWALNCSFLAESGMSAAEAVAEYEAGASFALPEDAAAAKRSLVEAGPMASPGSVRANAVSAIVELTKAHGVPPSLLRDAQLRLEEGSVLLPGDESGRALRAGREHSSPSGRR